ncbi:MAG TPA: ABC transporter permease [Phycisphaerales bacterium]|nr:ABC transporter permease [Phycisphaerales bacterium]
MILQTTTIARNTFIESVRQPVYFIVLVLAGLLQVFTTWSTAYSMGYTTSAEVSKDNKLLLDIGLATIFVAGVLLAAFVATAVLSREIETKTVLTVVSKPISRASVIFGKYLGVAGAITVAVVIMTVYLLLGLRHGVMSTAADAPDYPIIVFSTGAVALSIGVAGWCNFYYGWSFPQTASLLLLPAILLAYLLALLVGKEWKLQPISTDFKPQITIACAAILLALLVLSAVATAASTRLGQVMTIVVCAGVFLLGLLSNHLLGRHAYRNHAVGIVESSAPVLASRAAFDRSGDEMHVVLRAPPKAEIRRGAPIFYGPNPSGFMLAGGGTGAPGEESRGVVATHVDGRELTLTIRGESPIPERPPSPGDHLFLRPTQVNAAAAGLFAVVPNFHHYWLTDAVSQNNPIPPSHLVMLAGYAGTQIAAFLALAVLLFQRRDVG